MEGHGSFDETGEVRQLTARLETLRKDETVLAGYELDLVLYEIARLTRRLAALEAQVPRSPVVAGLQPAEDFWSGWDDAWSDA